MTSKKLEEQMILRLPPQLADQVRKMLRTKQLTEEIEFEFAEDQRNAKFKVGKKKYDAYLVDLPCIVESHKTLDKTTYYKSADIGQMLVVQDPKDPQPPPAEYSSLNGVTPATRDIRRRKWRKPPDAAMLKEIENEVNRLLKPAENESIEILNADDYEDLEELNGVVEKIEPVKPKQPQIVIKQPIEEGNAEASETKEKKKKERKKKEKKGKEGGEVATARAGVAAARANEGGEVKVKKERRRRKKKDEEGEGASQEGQPEGAAADKKKEKPKRRERKPKPKGAASEPALPSSPYLPSTPTSTSSPAFPFSNTITPLPPPMAQPVPSVFVQQPITTKIATPAFNANPFANALSPSTPISTTPISITTTPISTIPISTTAQPLVSIVPPSAGQEYSTLEQQKKKLQQEVDQLRIKVAEATNKYNILPNAILKQRHQGKLQEVTEQHAQKVKELEMVEKQMQQMRPNV